MLERQKTNPDIYNPLFSSFALRVVETLAELVYKHTEDMDVTKIEPWTIRLPMYHRWPTETSLDLVNFRNFR